LILLRPKTYLVCWAPGLGRARSKILKRGNFDFIHSFSTSQVRAFNILRFFGFFEHAAAQKNLNHTDEWGIEVYIDDIIIGAHSADALADAIDWLLERCAELRLTLSCRKSTIGTHAMKVLGKMVKYHSIEPTAERIAAIRDYCQPPTVGELRSFLGMMAQIASHVLIHKIAEINLLHTAASNLHTSGSNVEWTPELSTAFNVVKDTASKPETLVPFDETRQVFLLCDASDDGYGAWLCHLAPDTNRLQPIDIFSRALDSGTAQLHGARKGGRRSTPVLRTLALRIAGPHDDRPLRQQRRRPAARQRHHVQGRAGAQHHRRHDRLRLCHAAHSDAREPRRRRAQPRSAFWRGFRRRRARSLNDSRDHRSRRTPRSIDGYLSACGAHRRHSLTVVSDTAASRHRGHWRGARLPGTAVLRYACRSHQPGRASAARPGTHHTASSSQQ
jgi:hypothetical protein